MTTSRLFTAEFWTDALERVVVATASTAAGLIGTDAITGYDALNAGHIVQGSLIGGGLVTLLSVIAGLRGGDGSFRTRG